MTKEFFNSVVNECKWSSEDNPIHFALSVHNDGDECEYFVDQCESYVDALTCAHNKLNEFRANGEPYLIYVDGKILYSFDAYSLKWEA